MYDRAGRVVSDRPTPACVETDVGLTEVYIMLADDGAQREGAELPPGPPSPGIIKPTTHRRRWRRRCEGSKARLSSSKAA